MSSKQTSANLRTDTDIIWHYTSMDVFTKMMLGETGLYATHIRFLNDSSEFRYGLERIPYYLNEEHFGKQGKGKNNSYTEKIYNFIYQQLGMKQLNLVINTLEKVNDIYVTCFSRDCDSLYQWRCYTPQGGVALGFSRKALKKIIFGKKPKKLGKIGNSSYKQFSYFSDKSSLTALGCLGKCIYKEGQQKKIIIDLFSTVRKDDFLRAFFLACLLKHESFAFEKEERIIYAGIPCFDNIEIIGDKPRVPILGASRDEIRHLIKGVFVSPHGDKEHNLYLAHLWAHQYNLDWEPCRSCSPYVGG